MGGNKTTAKKHGLLSIYSHYAATAEHQIRRRACIQDSALSLSCSFAIMYKIKNKIKN
jgi:hypothetical protein